MKNFPLQICFDFCFFLHISCLQAIYCVFLRPANNFLRCAFPKAHLRTAEDKKMASRVTIYGYRKVMFWSASYSACVAKTKTFLHFNKRSLKDT